MKRTTFLLTLLLAMLTLPLMAQRQVIDFDFGWKFHLGDIDETKLASLGDVSCRGAPWMCLTIFR